MNVKDFFLAINVDLEFTHHSDDRVTVSGRNCEIKEEGILRSEYGSGSTRKKALDNYATAISGKRLVVNAMSLNRREYNIPSLLPKPRVTKKKVAKKKAKKKTSGSRAVR